jgi:hypothetical protein
MTVRVPSEREPDAYDEQIAPVSFVEYDPHVIRQYAAGLYSRALGEAVSWTITGVVGGSIGLYILARLGLLPFGLLVFVVGCVVGYLTGSARAFALKLQAQIALCQVQIEENTRGLGDSSTKYPASPD